jgi:PAS domain S-box-containing protein
MFDSEELNESQQTKAGLRESEEHYRAVAKAATDAIITIDSDSTILIVNPAAQRIFGYSTEEIIGQPLTMLMPEYLRHLHKAGISRYQETGQKHIGWSAVQ